MSADQTPQLLSLEDLLPSALARNLQALSPGISWALDTFAVSFGEEIQHLDQPAREAFARLTLNYGENLDRFLRLAREPLREDELRERERKMALLRELDLFSDLDAFDLGRIAGSFQPVVYEAGELLAVEGEVGKAVFFLERGRVGIIVDDNQVAIRGEGALFGETSCITGEPITATLKAVSQCELLVILREDFENLVLSLPEIIPKIARIGFSRLEEATQRLSEVLSHMPDALMKIDREGIITGDISSKCFHYLGQEVLSGKRFSEIFFKDHPRLQEEWEAAFPLLWDAPQRFHEADFAIPRVTDFLLGRDDPRHYRINLHPCLRRGEQEGFDVAISDLTEQKRVAEDRERMERALQRVKRKFMLFRLGGEIFGLEIERVREIIEMVPITRLPNAPEFLRGFFNLRGRIIPALDLHTLLELPRDESAAGCIFIVELDRQGEAILVGLVADAVEEILEVYDNDIEEAPYVAAGGASVDFILGMAKVFGGVRVLLNPEGLLTLNEQGQLSDLRPEGSVDSFIPEN